ncbi:MAG: hypothetical protein GY835_28275 [bacterium]|nr:hypothetical protein [bacterium]
MRFSRAQRRDELLWSSYGAGHLKAYGKPIAGKRISVSYQAPFQGTEQAARVLKRGLEDLGATVVAGVASPDIFVEIARRGDRRGAFRFPNANEGVVHEKEIHPDCLISSIVEALSDYFFELNPAIPIRPMLLILILT